MSGEYEVGAYEVVWPVAERRLKTRPLAKRLETLKGKTVAQLWDYLFAGDEVFLALEKKLSETYPDIKWVSWREFGSTHAVNGLMCGPVWRMKGKAISLMNVRLPRMAPPSVRPWPSICLVVE